MNRVVFSSASEEQTYAELNREFSFADDACPLGGNVNGLMREWKSPCFVNPPYSEITPWMEKAELESRQGKTVVMLVPSRTDTRWFHNFAMTATEIRFIKGRLKFGGSPHNAPFPSCVVVFRGVAMTPTPKQLALLIAIRDYRAQHDEWPTTEGIENAMIFLPRDALHGAGMLLPVPSRLHNRWMIPPGIDQQLSQAESMEAELLAALKLFVDLEEPHCRFDHNGFCQEHISDKPCRVAHARALIAKKESGK